MTPCVNLKFSASGTFTQTIPADRHHYLKHHSPVQSGCTEPSSLTILSSSNSSLSDIMIQ